jgi:hypothetical protein
LQAQFLQRRSNPAHPEATRMFRQHTDSTKQRFRRHRRRDEHITFYHEIKMHPPAIVVSDNWHCSSARPAGFNAADFPELKPWK